MAKRKQLPAPAGETQVTHTPEEKAVAQRALAQLEGRNGRRAPRYGYDKETHSLTYKETSEGVYYSPMVEMFGVSDTVAAVELQRQTHAALVYQRDAQDFNGPLALIDGIEPQNTLEGMLATQMVTVHGLAMKLCNKAAHSNACVDVVDRYLNQANKLMRTFATLTETLNKLRTGGKQTITVQHQQVNVGNGGQAVIGDIHNTGGMGG